VSPRTPFGFESGRIAGSDLMGGIGFTTSKSGRCAMPGPNRGAGKTASGFLNEGVQESSQRSCRTSDIEPKVTERRQRRRSGSLLA
jgi:hypothetical protein